MTSPFYPRTASDPLGLGPPELRERQYAVDLPNGERRRLAIAGVHDEAQVARGCRRTVLEWLAYRRSVGSDIDRAIFNTIFQTMPGVAILLMDTEYSPMDRMMHLAFAAGPRLSEVQVVEVPQEAFVAEQEYREVRSFGQVSQRILVGQSYPHLALLSNRVEPVTAQELDAVLGNIRDPIRERERASQRMPMDLGRLSPEQVDRFVDGLMDRPTVLRGQSSLTAAAAMVAATPLHRAAPAPTPAPAPMARAGRIRLTPSRAPVPGIIAEAPKRRVNLRGPKNE